MPPLLGHVPLVKRSGGAVAIGVVQVEFDGDGFLDIAVEAELALPVSPRASGLVFYWMTKAKPLPMRAGVVEMEVELGGRTW